VKNRIELSLAGVVRENITLRRQRDLLRRIAGQACLRIAGLELIVLRDNMRLARMEMLVARLRGKGGARRR
jgi:hypothetical protein